MCSMDPFGVVIADVTVNRFHQLRERREALWVSKLHLEASKKRLLRSVTPGR
jgi:hypothetical protein